MVKSRLAMGVIIGEAETSGIEVSDCKLKPLPPDVCSDTTKTPPLGNVDVPAAIRRSRDDEFDE